MYYHVRQTLYPAECEKIIPFPEIKTYVRLYLSKAFVNYLFSIFFFII